MMKLVAKVEQVQNVQGEELQVKRTRIRTAVKGGAAFTTGDGCRWSSKYTA
jgi:hypothetical protein